MNNALIELAHLLEFAATRLEPTLVVVPDAVQQLVPRSQFDYSFSWVCVANAAPVHLKVEGADLKDVYWWDAGPATNFGHAGLPSLHSVELKGLILAKIVMRPQPALRALVERLSPKGPYVAIHLRNLEGSCVERLKLEGLAVQRVTSRDLGREVLPADLCSMTGAYVRAALRMDGVPREWPILLVHDGQSKTRARKLRNRLRAAETNGTPFADLVIAVRSSYFIGNPASSFSANVVLIRNALGAPLESSNLRPHESPRAKGRTIS